MMEKEDREVIDKVAVEIREMIFDDAPDIVQSAMGASPIEVFGFASEWIKKAQSEIDRLKQENESLKSTALKVKLLLSKYDEYNQLLTDELNEVVIYAASHGWKTSRFEAGEKLRDFILNAKKVIE